MTNSTTNGAAQAQAAWDLANEKNMEFQFALMVDEAERADAARLEGLAACIELADLMRAGVPFFMDEPEQNRQDFMDEYPAGSTAAGLAAQYED